MSCLEKGSNRDMDMYIDAGIYPFLSNSPAVWESTPEVVVRNNIRLES
jgi:hypothetical protein